MGSIQKNKKGIKSFENPNVDHGGTKTPSVSSTLFEKITRKKLSRRYIWYLIPFKQQLHAFQTEYSYESSGKKKSQKSNHKLWAFWNLVYWITERSWWEGIVWRTHHSPQILWTLRYNLSISRREREKSQSEVNTFVEGLFTPLR